MTKDDEEKFQKAEECHICDKKYTEKILEFETTAISLENIEAPPIENVI